MCFSYKRAAGCYLLTVIMFLVCILRLLAVATDERYSAAAQSESRRVISLGYSRGTVFDCNMKKLTNERTEYYTLFFNETEALSSLYGWFSGEEIKTLTEEITQKGFAVRKLSHRLSADGVYTYPVSVNVDDSTVARHLIGYTDGEGRGVSGIQSAFDSLLYTEKENTLSFSISGTGERLYGEEPMLNYDYSTENSGVKLTVDKDIQQIAEQQAVSIKSGAIIISEVGTGKIRALVSRPDYKLSQLSTALSDGSEPLLCRFFSLYNIGSVFKPVVAAAGYEEGLNFSTNCVGYTDVDGLTFACHKSGGHGGVDITAALKFSCNSFFYQYIQNIGVEKIENISKSAGLLNDIYLANGIVCPKGKLGNLSVLGRSKRALANLSIGQGEMLLTPLAITQVYAAIANGGSYHPLSLVEATIKNGKPAEFIPKTAKVGVMSEDTAQKLKYDLSQVLSEGGTGESAKPTQTTAAGKTGTAQTGVIKNGKKVTNSWFCGFFPLENPKYAVTVLSENAAGGCGKVFAGVADAITELEYLRNRENGN